MRRIFSIFLPVGLLLLMQSPGLGQEAGGPISPIPDFDFAQTEIPDGDSPGRLSTALEIAIVITLVSLLPSILMTLTSFMRIMIVLSFVRRAMGTQQLPPGPVLAGLALFLTIFVMYPVGDKIYQGSIRPYLDGEASVEVASDSASKELGKFLLKNTRESDLALFIDIANVEQPETEEDIPFRVIVPAFILSELKTAFQMGFIIFLPFLVIDLVIASILLSMGMFMLPPIMISTPFKLLLFILVDGWNLVVKSLVTSFA